MIFVTGGTGLVGAQLLLDLIKSGNEVRAMKRSTSRMDVVNRIFRGNEKLLERIEWVEGDVTDIFSVEDAMKGVNQVYHCAAFVSFRKKDFGRLMKVNTEGTANMVNTAMHAGVNQFCHVSSTAALGRTDENILQDEESFWKTSKYNTGYAISKYSAEREVWRAMEEGLNAYIVNPSIIIGPGKLDSGSGALFGAVLKGLKFFPRGMSGFVDVRDVTGCMMQLMKKNIKNERFIINGENISYKEVMDDMAASFGKMKPVIRVGKTLSAIGWRAEAIRGMFTKTKPMITKETARNGLVMVRYSNEKIKKELGVEFIPVRKAVEDACKIYLAELR